jgi:hypothetical protein
MRKMLIAAAAGLAVAGGASAVSGAAQAQPYGYYTGNGYYGYRYDPPRAYGYDGRYTPYGYYNGYTPYGTTAYSGSAGLAGALLGAVIAPEVLGHAPYDQYGPDPNGMIAPDGHRIKCKLMDSYDSYYGQYRTRRECW